MEKISLSLKTIIGLIAVSAIATLSIPSAYAAQTCTTVYGAGQTCIETGEITINKTVLNSQTNTFVENLGTQDNKFKAEQLVNFQITVTAKNTAVSKINVTDTLPNVLTFVAGPGNFDTKTKTLSFEVNDLGANQSRTTTVVAKVVPNNELPNHDVTCVVNQSGATAGTQTVRDTAQLCIEKETVATTPTTVTTVTKDGKTTTTVVAQPTIEQSQPTGVVLTKGGLKVFPAIPAVEITKTPATGAESSVLMGLMGSGFIGYFLRKKALLT